MGINPAAFSSTSISEAGRAIIQILPAPPNTQFINDPPATPGMMVGYYNSTSEKVELYIASRGGSYWIRVS